MNNPAYQPKTDLGRKLLAIRERAVAKGLRLLTAEEILEEVERRRGLLAAVEVE